MKFECSDYVKKFKSKKNETQFKFNFTAVQEDTDMTLTMKHTGEKIFSEGDIIQVQSPDADLPDSQTTLG